MSAGSSSNPEARSQSAVLASLSQSLEALSAIGESLTFRLLELEQRLGALEGKTIELAEIQPTEGLNQETAATLECTERRIARLEDLLTNPNRIQATHAETRETVQSEEEFIEDNPFPDEVEQPFMDEFAA